MEHEKTQWSQYIVAALSEIAQKRGIDPALLEGIPVVVQKPPKPELGDLAVPLFPFAKVFRCAPQQIAEEAAGLLADKGAGIRSEGGYVNITLDLGGSAHEIFKRVFEQQEHYGHTDALQGVRAMVEFSCPNTNKPLHLGHLRNDSLGSSISRILGANGAQVHRVNLINDRGIHICKSMLAYKKFGAGRTPESEGVKSDHFVGDYYVKFSQWAKEYPEAEQEAQAMLQAWERGDEQTTALWKLMNRWTIEGIEETYKKTRIAFDDVYYESSTYSRGREEVLKGLEEGIFYTDAEGTVWVDLEDIGLDKKVLLRKDGTSLYLTQDIGTAILRHEQWPFDMMVYVVGSEQQYHFAVLFHVLSRLGHSWAERMYHLSYGMVNLPDGKMKSREGTVVDADDLVAELEKMARQEIIDKGRADQVGDLDATAEQIALGALNYYLLQTTPTRDMIFDPKKSIEFNGNTGPYLQYTGARLSSMLKKHAERNGASAEMGDLSLLSLQDERELIKMIAAYPASVKQAGEEKNPAVLTSYLYELTRTFSRFYHDTPVLRAETKLLVSVRITLCRGVLQVLKNGCYLLGIPFLESM